MLPRTDLDGKEEPSALEPKMFILGKPILLFLTH